MATTRNDVETIRPIVCAAGKLDYEKHNFDLDEVRAVEADSRGPAAALFAKLAPVLVEREKMGKEREILALKLQRMSRLLALSEASEDHEEYRTLCSRAVQNLQRLYSSATAACAEVDALVKKILLGIELENMAHEEMELPDPIVLYLLQTRLREKLNEARDMLDGYTSLDGPDKFRTR
ncbi:hypothetical protein [Gloeobacter morelensis]|uniref:hypothetical protein n=1 Tax=Gloeobacter morelensis TaxID=2907343 RepID=UPI001E4A65F1|nr:hypothetical protein [Gloeobacter morelensis]UFP97169.1 hypothetical protein ISF26_23905 [Gloeobacter morelensis MG652769]